MKTEDITDDLDRLVSLLPAKVQSFLLTAESRHQLLEVVLDLGRIPEARYSGWSRPLGNDSISRADLNAMVERLGQFGSDNRAGIERTLHRISAIRNRRGEVVGLTCRVGRAVFGTVAMVRDLLDSGESLLLMGRPGVGKTTALREIARVLADDLGKRVVVIDTSNEIAGDGDIPHPAIGHARRMQVARPELQHQVMIEAVENHMPEVIVIDEIGTELEARAARTIAERGVTLVATAHGNALSNLIKNPTLCDLVGGVESVTLGDDEARRRRSQKTVLERASDPTFTMAVEMHSRSRWAVYREVGRAVDALLRGQLPGLEERRMASDGRVLRVEPKLSPSPLKRPSLAPVPLPNPVETICFQSETQGSTLQDSRKPQPGSNEFHVLCCGLSEQRLNEAVCRRNWSVKAVKALDQADVVLSVRQKLGRQPELRRQAREAGIPILVIKSDTLSQVERALERLLSRRDSESAHRDSIDSGDQSDTSEALEECRLAIEQVVVPQGRPVELLPRSEKVRDLQSELVARYSLRSDVYGPSDQRRLRVFPP